MSGRLIISSKKGYCPWNARNISRVERDEKEHVQKLLVSRERLGSTNKGNDRFSLFKLEEKNSLLKPNDNSPQKEYNDLTTKIHGFENGLMDRRKISESKDKKNNAMKKESPFYLMARPIEKVLGMNEMNRKRQMDPMKDFHHEDEVVRTTFNTSETSCNKEDHKEESSRKRKRIKEDHDSRKNKRKKEHKKKDYFKNRSRVRCNKEKKNSNTDVSNASSESSDRHDFEFVEQLRKKRSEREQHERVRQDAIFDNTPYSNRDKNKSNGGHSYQFNSDKYNRRSL